MAKDGLRRLAPRPFCVVLSFSSFLSHQMRQEKPGHSSNHPSGQEDPGKLPGIFPKPLDAVKDSVENFVNALEQGMDGVRK